MVTLGSIGPDRHDAWAFPDAGEIRRRPGRFEGGRAMECFDDGWEDADLDAAYEAAMGRGVGPDEVYRRLVSDEEGLRFWTETAWSSSARVEDAGLNHADSEPVLFADAGAEDELCQELRLTELWDRCQRGFLTMDEFFELSSLITVVNGISGSLCVDCAMLDRPNVSANWALAGTTLCRGHLRFRLGYARIDGGGAHRPA